MLQLYLRGDAESTERCGTSIVCTEVVSAPRFIHRTTTPHSCHLAPPRLPASLPACFPIPVGLPSGVESGPVSKLDTAPRGRCPPSGVRFWRGLLTCDGTLSLPSTLRGPGVFVVSTSSRCLPLRGVYLFVGLASSWSLPLRGVYLFVGLVSWWA